MFLRAGSLSHTRRAQPWLLRAAAGGLAVAVVFALGSTPALAAAAEDLGDGPAGFDLGDNGPARATLTGPRLGTAITADVIDPETGVSVNASDSAAQDGGDDAIDAFGSLTTGRLITVSRDLAVSRVTAPAQVCGWVDFDQTGNYTDDERACATVAAGATTVRLTWSGQPAGAGPSYARFRIGSTPTQVEQPVGAADSGEVEDYPVTFVDPPVGPSSALTLRATAAPATVSAVGNLVTYTYTATNSGQTRLTGLAISDELPGLGPLSCGDTTVLAVGQSFTCRATRATTQDDLDAGAIFDYAQASGEAPGGRPGDSADDAVALDAATVTATVRPALVIVAKADRTTPKQGTKLTWTFRATNLGNVTLDAVRISGGLKGLSKLSCRPKAGARLTPGAALVCTGRYTVTAADAKRRSVTAAASVRAEAPYGDRATRSDDVVDRVSAKLTVARAVTTPAPAGSGSGSARSGGVARPTEVDGGLADTGGTAPLAPVGFAGLLSAGASALLLRRRRTD